MFFIDLDLESDKRFDISKFFEYTDAFDPINSYFLDKVKSLPIGGNFMISGEDGKPDFISYKIFGDTQYWWILMYYNDYINIEDMKSGDIIYYPTLDSLENFYFTLKIRQTALES
jgi:hypothetical protein